MEGGEFDSSGFGIDVMFPRSLVEKRIRENVEVHDASGRRSLLPSEKHEMTTCTATENDFQRKGAFLHAPNRRGDPEKRERERKRVF